MYNIRKIAILFLALISGAVIVFISCSKERLVKNEDLTDYENIEQFYEYYESNEQEYTITEDGDGPLIGEEGTKIWLSKDILMFTTGDSVTFPYTILLTEVFYAKDMILNQKSSTSNGNILGSAGIIRIRAFKDDLELILRPECTFPVAIPHDDPYEGRDDFYGFEAGDNVEWTNNLEEVNVDPVNSYFEEDFEGYGYEGMIAKLGWVNCANFADFDIVDEDDFTTVTFSSSEYDLSEIPLFMYFPNIHSVVEVEDGTSMDVPIGERVVYFMVAIGDQQALYYFKKTDIIAEDDEISISLVQTDEDNLIDVMDGLD